MRVQLLHYYKGLPSAYIRLEAGSHDLAPELAQYLVDNGHAIELESDTNPATPDEDYTVETPVGLPETEVPVVIPPKKKRR